MNVSGNPPDGLETPQTALSGLSGFGWVGSVDRTPQLGPSQLLPCSRKAFSMCCTRTLSGSRITPITSKPCCFKRYAATLESTPPLIPRSTRCLVRLIRAENFDQAACESIICSRRPLARRNLCAQQSSAPRFAARNGYSFTARLTKELPRKVNRHGKCADRLMPMRLSAMTSNEARELDIKQWSGSEHRSIS